MLEVSHSKLDCFLSVISNDVGIGYHVLLLRERSVLFNPLSFKNTSHLAVDVHWKIRTKDILTHC